MAKSTSPSVSPSPSPIKAPSPSIEKTSTQQTAKLVRLRVVAVTPIIAPVRLEYEQLPSNLKALLEKKYGQELAKHLDKIFFRSAYLDDGNRLQFGPWISGRAVKASLFPGREVNGEVLGLWFREENVSVLTEHVTKKDGVASLINVEAVEPGAQGILVLTENLVNEIQPEREYVIGSAKSRGFGRYIVLK